MRPSLLVRATFLVALCIVFASAMAHAQLVDRTRAPHTEDKAAVQKSLAQQVGAGRGNTTTPNSSLYLILRDPFRSVRRGRQIFQRKFAVEQGMGPITGDGAGDIELDDTIGAGLSDSCAGCHGRPRGSAGYGGDVATRPDSRALTGLRGPCPRQGSPWPPPWTDPAGRMPALRRAHEHQAKTRFLHMSSSVGNPAYRQSRRRPCCTEVVRGPFSCQDLSLPAVRLSLLRRSEPPFLAIRLASLPCPTHLASTVRRASLSIKALFPGGNR